MSFGAQALGHNVPCVGGRQTALILSGVYWSLMSQT